MSRLYHQQRPEAVLQRAQEFISVGKEQDALNALHEIIKLDRRHKQWSQTFEMIMLKYIELCVSLKNSTLAKDGLYQYKILTQQVAAKSLETVLEKYLSLAEGKTSEAQKHSIEKVEEIDDLDAADAPERLLLSVVSGAVTQDRMDRTVLSPWLRFLWDAYRNSLDLLRNNVLFEQLYHQIARHSFGFCVKYQRRNEFRKLCETLRQHLGQIQKSSASHAVKLSNVESLAMMMETRLVQLETAILMELWQEAYKSAEDLHTVMQLTKDKDKKIVRPTNYANYYDKIALVFWKGNNTLFHAAALLQKFNIYKDMKKTFTDEEALDQATRVLLATLSIPDGADTPSVLTKHLDIEELHTQNIRILSALLRLPVAPTRVGLFKEILRLNLTELAAPFAQDIYKCTEMEFNPLRAASIVQQSLAQMAELNRPEYSQYIQSINSSVTIKILKQLATVYDSLSMDRITEIIPFYGPFELEQILVETSKHHSLKAQIDHRTRSINFAFMDTTLGKDVETEFSGEQEEFATESVQNHLKFLYSKLGDIFDQVGKGQIKDKLMDTLKKGIHAYLTNKDQDYEDILIRRKKIESYKENSENMRLEKLNQERELQNRLEHQRKQEELKRLEQINRENEKKRREAEREEIEKKLRMEKIRRIQSNPLAQQIIKERGEQVFHSMDPEEVLREQRHRMDKERKDQQSRLQQQEKKFDHTIRAYHIEEMKVRMQISEERLMNAPDLFDAYETNRIEKSKQDHDNSFISYERLQTAQDDTLSFIRNVIKEHTKEFNHEHEQWKKALNEARQKVLTERKFVRKLQKQKLEEQKLAEAKQAAERKKLDEDRKADQAKRQQQQQQTDQQRQPFSRENRSTRTISSAQNAMEFTRDHMKPAAAIAREQRPPDTDNMPTQQVQRFSEFTRPPRILKKETEFTRDAMKKVDKPPEPLFDRDQMRPPAQRGSSSQVSSDAQPKQSSPTVSTDQKKESKPEPKSDQLKYKPPALRNRQS